MKKRMKPEGMNASETSQNDEIDIFKHISSLRHRSGQNIRMSLTLRIAGHYCSQLMRSWFTLIPCTLLVLCLMLFPQYRSVHHRILLSAPDNDIQYTQQIIQDAYVSAEITEDEIPEGIWNRTQYTASHLFRRIHKLQICIPRKQKVEPFRTVLIIHHIQRELYVLFSLAVLLLMADLIRMGYFLRHHHRLDKTVLRPIRDMTDLAATVSANNLSNRINVEGTKNELRDLAVVMNSMLDRIELSYESQKQFVSDASHELRTPISVIQGYADMLGRWGKDDPQVLQEGIDAISQEASNMKDLVQDLLFLARHDKKTLMMEMSVFDPVDLLSEIKKEAEMVTPQDSFVMDPSDHLQLQADRNMIKQVMRILLDNAVKYTPSGGTITMGCRAGKNACILTMKDTGEGISSEDLPRIFDRFYRADKARKSDVGGHGLGLSIARIIVVAHGGKIRVRSKVGEGTLFTVEIPYDQKPSGEKQIEEQKRVTRSPRFFIRRKSKAKTQTDDTLNPK